MAGKSRPVILEDLEKFFEWCLEKNIEILDPKASAPGWLQAMDGFHTSDLRHLCTAVKEIGAVPELRICLTMIKGRTTERRERKPLEVVNCRSCHARITWMTTRKGKKMPVDADTAADGDTLYQPAIHRSHFETCPDRDKWGKKRKDAAHKDRPG